jgi:DNA-binding MarR family transcriptional regulator
MIVKHSKSSSGVGVSAGRIGSNHEKYALRVLMHFRQIVSAAKRHFQGVQNAGGITDAQLWALWQIDTKQGLSAGELARHMSIHQSTASNLVHHLEAGLVYRTRAGLDQRVVRMFPTSAGEAILKKAPGPMHGVLPDAVHQLPDTELRRLCEALELLSRRIISLDVRGARTRR